MTVTVGNANVDVDAMVGDNTIVGVNAAAGVTVFVGVNVATDVSVNVSAVAVMSVLVGMTCPSLEGAQAEANRKIMKAIRTIFN